MLKSTVFNLFFKRSAGHSKWANIRHIKGQKDAERNVLFTKLSRQVRVAIQEGGSLDPKANLKLSQVIEQCKRFNMPQATLNNILKSCENDKTNAKLHLLEIKGPGTSILLCEIFTNNLHIIKQNITSILRKNQSKYGDGGAVYLFEEKGIIHAENSNLSTKPNNEQIEIATEDAIDSNAEEVSLVDENVFEFLCGKTNFMEAQKILESKGYNILHSTVEYIPHKSVYLAEPEYATYEKLLSKLKEFPEVTGIYDNVNTE
ncbi:translational activator of cytochrome c oxidase 1 [Rhynchophorus ferrugineus]|uniref:translational activator of cytochrome c oxidase 1 n=1 Tax=Rhynchophorus ferrugineus TaxID=354439 RepID=UPI003FCD9F3A